MEAEGEAMTTKAETVEIGLALAAALKDFNELAVQCEQLVDEWHRQLRNPSGVDLGDVSIRIGAMDKLLARINPSRAQY